MSCPDTSTVHTLSEAFGYEYTGNAMADFAAQSYVKGPLPTDFVDIGNAISNSSFSNTRIYDSNASNSVQNASCTLGSYQGTPTLQLLLGTYEDVPANLSSRLHFLVPRPWLWPDLLATDLIPVLPQDSIPQPTLGLNVNPAKSTASNTVSIAGSMSKIPQPQPTIDQGSQSAPFIPLVSISAPAAPIVLVKPPSDATLQAQEGPSAVNLHLQSSAPLAPSNTPLVVEAPSPPPLRADAGITASSPSIAQGSRFPAASNLPDQQTPYPAAAITTTYASVQTPQSEHASQQVTQGVATAIAPTQAAIAMPASEVAGNAPFQSVNLQTTNVNVLVTSRNNVGLIVTATIASAIVYQSTPNPVLASPQTIVSEGGALASPSIAVTHSSPQPAQEQSVEAVVHATSTNEAGSIITLPSTVSVPPLPSDRSLYTSMVQTANVVHTVVKTFAGGYVYTGLSTSAFVYQVPVVSNPRTSATSYIGASTTGIRVPVASIDALGSTHLSSRTSNLVYLPYGRMVSSGPSTLSLARSVPQGAVSSVIVVGITSTDSRGSTILTSSTSPILVLPLPSEKLDMPGRLQFGSQTVKLFPSAAISPVIVNIAGQTVTANPTGFQIDGHSIVPGAQGVTVSGTPISLGTSGQLKIGSQTIALPIGTPYSTTGVLISATLTGSAGKIYTTASTSDLVFESLPPAGKPIPLGAYTTALVEEVVKTDARGSVYTSSLTTSILAIPNGVRTLPSPTSSSILIPLTTTDSSGHTYTTLSTSNLVFEAIPTAGASTPLGAFTTIITEGVVLTDGSGPVYTSSLTTSVLALPTGNPGNSSSSGVGGAIISGLTPPSAGYRVHVHWWIAFTSMIATTGFFMILVNF